MKNTEVEKVVSNDKDAVKKKTLEEDDEFEDFPADVWQNYEEVQNKTDVQTNLWEEDWDDVEVDDDFTKELRAELERQKQIQQQ